MSRGIHYAVNDDQVAPFLKARGDEDALNSLLGELQALEANGQTYCHFTGSTYVGLECFLYHHQKRIEHWPWRALVSGSQSLHGESGSLMVGYVSPIEVEEVADALEAELGTDTFGVLSVVTMFEWGISEGHRTYYLDCLAELMTFYKMVAERGDHVLFHIQV